MSEELWELASWLIDRSAVIHVSPETLRRAGISRAYYAAYHQCRMFLRVEPAQNIPHKRLRILLSAKGEEFRIWANNLRVLYSLREVADYRHHIPVTDFDAQESLRLSREILDRLAG
jgi:uncharacterized protein (UPF0332 family)